MTNSNPSDRDLIEDLQKTALRHQAWMMFQAAQIQALGNLVVSLSKAVHLMPKNESNHSTMLNRMVSEKVHKTLLELADKNPSLAGELQQILKEQIGDLPSEAG